MRSLARTLNARAMLHLGEGRPKAAWQDLMACHRLARLLGQGPTLIEPLGGFAIESVAISATLVFLETTQPTSKQVANYLRDLDSLAPLPDMAVIVDRAERYIYLDCAMIIANGSMESLDFIADPGDKLGPLLSGVAPINVDWNVTLRTVNTWCDRRVEAMKKPTYAERKTALDKLVAEWKALVKKTKNAKGVAKRFAAAKSKPKEMGQLVGDFMVASVFAMDHPLQLIEDRYQQKHANIRIAFALAGYKADNGDYPKSLDKLAPKYLKQIPRDLFSGKPLKYRRTKAGYVLRSVGPTGKTKDANRYGLSIRMPLPKSP